MDWLTEITFPQAVLTALFLFFVGGAVFSKYWFVRRTFLTVVLAFFGLHAVGYLPEYIPALKPYLERPASDQLIYFFAAMALLGIFFVFQNSEVSDEQLDNNSSEPSIIVSIQRCGAVPWWSLVFGVSLALSTVIQVGLNRHPETTNRVFERIGGPAMQVVNDKLDCEKGRRDFKEVLRMQGNDDQILEFEKLWALEPC